MPSPYTYSFLSVLATINGPNGTFSLGYGAGPSDEGITIEMAAPKNTRTTGADGSWMHSLHAGQSGKITCRFLKTSPVNSQLMTMYNADTSDPASHGQNTISVTSILAGDQHTCEGCAFAQQPTNTYGTEGAMLEWVFDVGRIRTVIGSGPAA